MIKELLTNNLAILPLIFLLIMAPIINVIKPKHGFIALIIILLSNIYISGLYLLNPKIIFYVFGDWQKSLGIELRFSIFSVFMQLMIAFCSIFSLLTCRKYFQYIFSTNHHSKILSLFTLLIAALNGLCHSNDLFNIYVFIEVLSLTSYGLIAVGTSKRSLMASFKYLIIGTIAGGFYLLAVAIIYLQTGNLNLTTISEIGGSLALHPTLNYLVLWLLIMSFAIKMGIFPFSSWLVDSYAYSPHLYASFAAGITSKIYIILIFKIFTQLNFLHALLIKQQNVIIIGLLISTVISGIFGCFAINIRKIFAWSGISNISYILIILILSLNNNLNYEFKSEAIITLMLFIYGDATLKPLAMSYMLFFNRKNIFNIFELKGVTFSNYMEYLQFILIILLFAGLPPTAIFFGKLGLLNILADKYYYIELILYLISLSLGMVGAIKIIRYAPSYKFIESKNNITSNNYQHNFHPVILIIYILAITLGMKYIMQFKSLEWL